MIEPVQVEFDHGKGHYRAVVDNQSDALEIHHITVRCGRPFERRMFPSRTPGREVPALIDKALEAFVDEVLDGRACDAPH